MSNYTPNIQDNGIYNTAASATTAQQVYDGVVDPVAAPADTTVSAIYTNTLTGAVWIWSTTDQAWQKLIG